MCHNCGKTGHFKSRCPMLAKAHERSNEQEKAGSEVVAWQKWDIAHSKTILHSGVE